MPLCFYAVLARGIFLNTVLIMFNTDSRLWSPDPSQQKIIDIDSGRHLVLAPPGCGKTQILAERIHKALSDGVKAADMLCLTFTNRAARGMRERINERVGVKDSEEVFVGNVHRFCSRFLFANGIVPAESAVIDDETANSILARYMNEDESKVEHDFRRKRAYAEIVHYSHFMYDIEHRLPKPLRTHPECVTAEDIAVMRAIAKVQDRPFDAALMTDIYAHTDFYLDLVRMQSFNPLLRDEATQSLMKMRYAHAYTAYKRLNNLLDFEDLLQLTYSALKENNDYKHYPWVQVDEVQDLNMLQLAIIHELSDVSDSGDGQCKPCVLFLGDEQQAIFSFMGAKLSTLNVLKERCEGNIHHLGVNHRSPRPLLEMLNAYAVSNLHSDPSLLPMPSADDANDSDCKLRIIPYENIWAEFKGVAKRAASLMESNDGSTAAIIVNSNRDADEVSKALDAAGHAHFKISGTDLFSTPEVKLLLAHLSVLDNDHNFLAWSRVMRGMRVCETPASARQFVHQLRKVGITPSDFLRDAGPGTFDSNATYLCRFVNAYDSKDIVVFDTETTGLDVFSDDIIQIAAERIRQGKMVDKFSVYIDTDKPIPAMLGDIENPIIEERIHQRLYTHSEALRMFLDFVGDSPLLAHNAEFDRHILFYNIKRYLVSSAGQEIPSWDSLKLIRLLRPDLHAFKLKVLLRELGLEGENSHLADDDVNATVSLVNYCYAKAKELLPAQAEYLSRKATQERVGRVRRNYGDYYRHGISQLYDREPKESGVPALVDELRHFYHEIEGAHWIKPVGKIDYVFRYLAKDVIDEQAEPSLKEQLDNHIMEINTFKEADLCGSSTITDRLFVSTIHKAKGLEFDHVFVFDAVDGRIPSYYNENNPTLLAEDARKLYVAMSRARHNLFVSYSRQGPSPGMPERKVSRFLEPVMRFF